MCFLWNDTCWLPPVESLWLLKVLLVSVRLGPFPKCHVFLFVVLALHRSVAAILVNICCTLDHSTSRLYCLWIAGSYFAYSFQKTLAGNSSLQKKTLQHIQIAIRIITSAQTDLEFLLFCLQKGESLRIRMIYYLYFTRFSHSVAWRTSILNLFCWPHMLTILITSWCIYQGFHVRKINFHDITSHLWFIDFFHFIQIILSNNNL